MSGSTTSKARSDRLAGSRRTSRSVTRSRLRDSINIHKRPREAPTDFARAARTAKSARPWDASGEDPAARFEGYSEAVETEKKILRDVFKAGDAWMRTGDLMRRDADGFYTFVDRIGDTFRWKGENVAAFEVAGVLRACPGVAEAIVYGVSVPGADGRAGMALLKIDGQFDLDVLVRRLETLPPYARPLFLRLAREIADHGDLQTEAARLCRAGLRSGAR